MCHSRGYRASDRPDRAPELTCLFRSFSARTNPWWRGLCIKPQIIAMLYASHRKQLSITRVPIHEKRVRARSNTRILNMRLLLPAWPIVTASSGRLSWEACPPKRWPPRPEPRHSKRWNWTIPSPKLRRLWRPCDLSTTGTGPPPRLNSSAPSNSIRATPPPTLWNRFRSFASSPTERGSLMNGAYRRNPHGLSADSDFNCADLIVPGYSRETLTRPRIRSCMFNSLDLSSAELNRPLCS